MARIRTLTRGKSRLHLFGVENYASARGGDELFSLIDTQKPASVLMESFAVADVVATSGVIPYRAHLDPRGLEKASAMVVGHDFRAALSCEVVGVLTAMRIGAEVVFADRQHTLSFDKLVARLSMDELRQAIIAATEAFAASLETDAKSTGTGASHPPGRPPQNILCRLFPELWDERHLVMAHVVEQTMQRHEGGDIALVVGAEHIEHVVNQLDRARDGGVDALLRESASSPNTPLAAEELEKRAALGALLVSTQTFPPEYVLQPAEDMDKDSLAIVRNVYPKYRWAIDRRLNQKQNDASSPYDRLAGMLQGGESVRGLTALEELCESLAE